MKVGQQIKIYLIKNNISQTWLSIETKIPLPKLNALLNGKRHLKASEFVEIVKALKIDANTFINY